MSLRFNIIILIGLPAAALLSAAVKAVPPSDDTRAAWIEQGTYATQLSHWRQFKRQGGCSADEHTPLDHDHRSHSFAASETVDSAHVLVIMVEFTDHRFSGQSVASTPDDFDFLLFADTGRSMTDYFREVSYGRFALTGDVVGPFLMPNSYASYVGMNNGLTGSPLLARQAIDAAHNSGVNFQDYDRNNDDICDGVILIHPGGGAETGTPNAIWSHKNSVFGSPIHDGISIPAYTMNPEERGNSISGIGVYCHEYGHILGLPDLYDISGNPSATGIGNFGLMGTGCWLGYGGVPAHLTAWSKLRLGWLEPIEIEQNSVQQAIPQSATSPVAFMLRPNRGTRAEYWLVENRQKQGYDKLLPASGLCIYHVDESRYDNSDASAYLVAIEQADGHNSLAVDGSTGDAGDLWPGSANNRSFHDQSQPSSRSNTGAATEIAVWNISDTDSLMYADFDVTFSRPYLALQGNAPIGFIDSPGGDGDGIFEAGERIAVELAVTNLMLPVYNPRVYIESSSRQVQPSPAEAVATVLDNQAATLAGPLGFSIADTLIPAIDELTFTIVADSLPSGGASFETSFTTDVELGRPQILIIDDDRGAAYEDVYTAALARLRLPSESWNVLQQGAPTAATLENYRTVIWFTGDSTAGALTADDAATMRRYLTFGGSIILSSISGAWDLAAVAPSLLPDYFGAIPSGAGFSPWIKGLPDGSVGDGLEFVYRSGGPPMTALATFATTGAARGEFELYFGAGSAAGPSVGVSNVGDGWRTVILSFPPEYLGDRFNTADDLLERALTFTIGGATGSVQTPSGRQLPQSFSLHQNYPNPFNPSTSIAYELAYTGRKQVRLELFNVLGRRVAVLIDDIQSGGRYQVVWDGRSDGGERVASGVYLYRLTVDGASESRKMVLLK